MLRCREVGDSMKEINLSVIIPTYNTGDYIRQCIMSFVNQESGGITYEIIVCDDGSDDETIKIVEEICESHQNAILYKYEHIGVGNARNKGIENASGRYVYFCDSDDYVENNFFKELSQLILNEKSDIIFFGYNNLVNNKIISSEIYRIDGKNSKYDHFFHNSCVWSSIYRKTLFTSNNIKFPEKSFHQDDAVYFRLIDKAYNVCNVQKALYNYRRNRPGSNMSSKTERYFNDILISSELNLNYFKENGCEESQIKIKDVYVSKLFDYAIYNLAFSKKETASEYYVRMIKQLNDFSSDWGKNKYFTDKNANKKVKVLRNVLKHRVSFELLNTRIFKNFIRRGLNE